MNIKLLRESDEHILVNQELQITSLMIHYGMKAKFTFSTLCNSNKNTIIFINSKGIFF